MSAVPVRGVLEGVEDGIVDVALTAVAPHRQVAQASQWKKLFTAASGTSREDKDIKKAFTKTFMDKYKRSTWSSQKRWTLLCSRADTDPHWFWSAESGSASALGMRIRIQEGKSAPQKYNFFLNFMFWSAWCSLLGAKGSCCSLNVFYGGLVSKLYVNEIFDIKILFNCWFWSIFGHQNPGSGTGSILT